MITAINSTQRNNQPMFKAHFPETLGKKACDRMAKQLMEYGTLEEQNFAQKYYASIKKIKKEKEIDEVLLCSTSKVSLSPYVSADGFHVRYFDKTIKPETATKKEQQTLHLMHCVNFVADTLKNVIIGINAL